MHTEPLTLDFSVEFATLIVSGALKSCAVAALSKEPASVVPVHSVKGVRIRKKQITLLLLLLGQTTELDVVPGPLADVGLFVMHTEPLTLDFSVEFATLIVSGALKSCAVAALSKEPASVVPVHSVKGVRIRKKQITLLLLPLGQTTELDVVPGPLAHGGLFVMHTEPLILDFSVEFATPIVSGALKSCAVAA